MQITRRSFFFLSILSGGATLLAACQAAPTQPGPPRASSLTAVAQPQSGSQAATIAPTGTGAPRAGGVLQCGVVGDYPTLDGQTIWASSVDTLWGIWDRLTAYDSDLRPQPMLAESWNISPDYTSIELRLRRGVHFHTGRELTSQDVKWCLQRLQDPKSGSTLTGRAAVISDVDTPDTYTVVIKASRPWVEVFDTLEYVNIIDPITFQSAGVSRPTGTGPFVLGEYAQGDHLWLTRNRNYWRKDRPYLDEVRVAILGNAQTAATQLEAGALDMVTYGLSVADTVRLRNTPGYQVLIDDNTGAFWGVVANCAVPPTNDKRVRQALNYALDRQRITDTIWHGLAKPEMLPWSPTALAYDPVKAGAFAFDIDKAKMLLAQAGASNLQFDLAWSTGIEDWAAVAQIYQADLARAGVKVTLTPMERLTYTRVLQEGSFTGLMIVGGLNGHLRPGTMILGPYYGPQINWSKFKDEAYTQLANQVLTETDAVQQKHLSDELNDYFLDQSWVMPISQSPPHLVARANVRGLRYDAHEALVLSDAWLMNGA